MSLNHPDIDEPRVAIVVVNYNNVDDIRVCLKSLSGISYRNYFVVVVDNDSNAPDAGSLGPLVRKAGQVFIQSPENRGFAAANNIGIHYSKASDADYIWLLNPDTVVDRESLGALVKAAGASRGLKAFGSKVLYGPIDAEEASAVSETGYARGGRIWSAGGSIDYETRQVSMIGWNEKDDGVFDTQIECDYLPGCSMFFATSLLNVVGLMPEEFFMYFEETEWCRRMKDAGVSLIYVPESVVWHRFEDEKLQRPSTVYYYNRNELCFWYRCSNPAGRVKMLWSIISKKLPEIRRAEKQAPDRKHRAVFAAHEAACWDFIFRRMGKRESL